MIPQVSGNMSTESLSGSDYKGFDGHGFLLFFKSALRSNQGLIYGYIWYMGESAI